ncbi:uncharacterized protein LOC123868946 isoform X1 [Maniola jurtina]|uniref:uncharacterized protein LOC123868946 isoform X1 n=1 Tax=Maniola jurtina TaxID=191418 RepID=UPI001E68F0FD|nr:uncharacterized protein LOC123868946 isoform X1 [Maniola jurtina]
MASDEQFSLCWNNFHANMSAGFHGLLSRGDLVDVTLAAEGRLLQAHKLVLSVCSPYFQEMFKMNPTHHPIVFLKDVSHSALRDLLQFMYQGEVNVKQEELASFISTAEQLQVKGLTGNQNEESSTPSKPKPTSRPGPRSSQQRQSVMTKLETDLDSKPSSTPVAIKRPNRPSIASNNSSSSQSGPVKRKCVDPLEAGPSGSAKEEFVTIPDEDENNAVAPKMEPEFVNESMWDEDDDGTNNDETNFGEDDSNMEMSGFDGSTTGDGNITGGGEGGAVGDAQEIVTKFHTPKRGWRYKRKTARGLVSPALMLRAAREVKNNGKSIRSVAKDFAINHQTLTRYCKKFTTEEINNTAISTPFTKTGYQGTRKIFTDKQEEELKKYILLASSIYFRLTPKHARKIAFDLATSNNWKVPKAWESNKLAGTVWFGFFLNRHPTLVLETPKSTFLPRATSFKPHNVKSFFEDLFLITKRYNIQHHEIWSMDEIGVTTVQKSNQLVARKEFKEATTLVERGALVTVVAAVSGGGNSVPPFFVFPRMHFKDHYIRDGPIGCKGGSSPSGWMTEELFVVFLKHFHHHVKSTKKNPCLLLLDNDSSHLSIEGLNFAKENGIIMLSFPSHSPHRLQPLHRSVYKPLNTYVSKAMNQWMVKHPGQQMTMYEIPEIIAQAFPSAATPSNILTGFKTCGICPFNREICQDHDFMPLSINTDL